MESKNMIGGIVSLAVVIVCVAAIMMPVLTDAQRTVGPEATFNNEALESTFKYEIWENEAITFAFSGGNQDAEGMTTAYTINGEANGLDIDSSEGRILIASSDFSACVDGTESVITVTCQHIGNTSQMYGLQFEFDVSANGDYVFTLGGNEYPGHLDWLVYAIPDGTANLCQLNTPTDPFYTSYDDKIIVLGNTYTSGDNDTFYSYYDGQLSVNPTYASVSSVEIDKTLKSGYTDIYDTTLEVQVGDESFVPYFILAPITVTGHEASGSLYSLYGVIPVVVIISIVLMSVGMAVSKRD